MYCFRDVAAYGRATWARLRPSQSRLNGGPSNFRAAFREGKWASSWQRPPRPACTTQLRDHTQDWSCFRLLVSTMAICNYGRPTQGRFEESRWKKKTGTQRASADGPILCRAGKRVVATTDHRERTAFIITSMIVDDINFAAQHTTCVPKNWRSMGTVGSPSRASSFQPKSCQLLPGARARQSERVPAAGADGGANDPTAGVRRNPTLSLR